MKTNIDEPTLQAAEKLCALGWTASNDAQWEGLRDALPELRNMLGGQASLEAAIARMESMPAEDLSACFDDDHVISLAALKRVKARLIAAARGPINLEAAVGASPGSFAQTCDDSKTGELPMSDPPWIQWHGGPCPLKDEEVEKWQYRFRDGFTTNEPDQPSGYVWTHTNTQDDIIAYRVLKWREGNGPDTVPDLREALAIADRSADEQMRYKREAEARAEKAEGDFAELWAERNGLKALLKRAEAELTEIKDYLWPEQTGLPNEHRDALIAIKRRDKLLTYRAEKAEAELAKANEAIALLQEQESLLLSRLRPLAEANPVPAGAVRVTGYKSQFTDCSWILGEDVSERDTHYADILLPEASQPAVEAKADPFAELKAAHAEGKVIEVFVKDDEYGPDRWSKKENSSWTLPPECYRIKPEPATFTAHGQVWTRHTPGDPMPCDGNRLVHTLFKRELGHYLNDVIDDAKFWEWTKRDDEGLDIIGWRYADEPTPEPAPTWQPAVGDVVKANPVQDMALGGQMYWRDLARQLAEVWWKCHNIGASLQHGDIDTNVSFSVVCEQHGGQCFHADTPHNAWLKAEKWLMSPDRANFPASTLQPV